MILEEEKAARRAGARLDLIDQVGPRRQRRESFGRPSLVREIFVAFVRERSTLLLLIKRRRLTLWALTGANGEPVRQSHAARGPPRTVA